MFSFDINVYISETQHEWKRTKNEIWQNVYESAERVLKDFIQFCALTLKRNFAKFEVRNDFETC